MCGGVAGALGVGAAEILPGMAIAGDIVRQGEPLAELKAATAPIGHVVQLAMPDFFDDPLRLAGWGEDFDLWMNSPYIGLLAAALAGVALLRVRDRRVWALAAVAATGAAFAYLPVAHDLAYGVVPLWSRFRLPARWLAVTNVGTAALAGLGADLLARRGGRAQGLAALAGLAGLPFVYIAWRRPPIPAEYLSPEVRTLAVLAAVAAVSVVAARRWPAALLLAVGTELALVFVPYFPRLRRESFPAYIDVPEMRFLRDSAGPGRVARMNPARTPLHPNTLMFIGRPDASAISVYLQQRYARFWNVIEDHGSFAADFNEIPSLARTESAGSPLVTLAGVRYLVVAGGDAAPSGWARVFDGVVDVHENPSRYPDAWVAPVRRIVPPDGVGRELSRAGFDPLSEAVVEGPAGSTSGRGGPARLRSTPDEMIVRLPPGASGELVVPHAWHPGWRVTIDGRRAAAEPVDMAFIGVRVRAANRVVRLSFDWPAVRIGRLVSAVFVLMITLAWAAGLWRRRLRPAWGSRIPAQIEGGYIVAASSPSRGRRPRWPC